MRTGGASASPPRRCESSACGATRMRVLSSQGDPALKEHRTVCFLAFDGHCYMYRAVKRVLERQAARALQGRGEADPAAHRRVEAL